MKVWGEKTVLTPSWAVKLLLAPTVAVFGFDSWF
jgi:hypothetical protein